MNHVKYRIIFDGNCKFCQASVRQLKWLDFFHKCEFIDYQAVSHLAQFHPSLTPETAASQMHLIAPNGKIYGGFFAFRRIAGLMPLLFPLLILLYLPFASSIGSAIYRWVSRHRYLSFNRVCKDHHCYQS